MALATLNGLDVVSAHLWMPRVGVWTGDLIVDSEAPPTGKVTFQADGGLALSGFANRSGAYLATTYIRIVGGADGLRAIATPKFYAAANAGLVLGDLLATAGEKLSATSDPTVLSSRLAGWTTIAQPIGSAIAVLLARGAPAGSSWRVLADGTVWVGTEAWPDSGLLEQTDYVETNEWPGENRIELGVETLKLLPGTTLGDRKVSFVEHILRDGYVRSRALLEDPS